MKAEKFTPVDRKFVTDELAKLQKTTLEPVKSFRKIFRDEKEMIYVVFGGKNDWHGLNGKMIEYLKNYKREGALVIAKKYRSKIDLCVGSLSMFISNFDRLINTQKGDLQFHCELTEDGLFIKEIPELFLNRITEIPLAGQSKLLHRNSIISKIINIEIQETSEITHSDIQAKLILIGSYLGH